MSNPDGAKVQKPFGFLIKTEHFRMMSPLRMENARKRYIFCFKWMLIIDSDTLGTELLSNTPKIVLYSMKKGICGARMADSRTTSKNHSKSWDFTNGPDMLAKHLKYHYTLWKTALAMQNPRTHELLLVNPWILYSEFGTEW